MEDTGNSINKDYREYGIYPIFKGAGIVFLLITVGLSIAFIITEEYKDTKFSILAIALLAFGIWAVREIYTYYIRLYPDHIELSYLFRKKKIAYYSIQTIKIYKHCNPVKFKSKMGTLNLSDYTVDYRYMIIDIIDKVIEANPNVKMEGELKSFERLKKKYDLIEAEVIRRLRSKGGE